jgi:hypothetical protein
MFTLSRTSLMTSSACALLWLAACSPPVQAAGEQSDLLAGHVLVCDTPEEVEAVLASDVNDMAGTLAKVNDRFGKDACNVVTAIFYEREHAKTVLSQDGAVRIIKVDMISVQSGAAWTHMARPVPQYAGVLVDSTSV